MKRPFVIALIALALASGTALAAGTAESGTEQKRPSMSQLDKNLDGRISEEEAKANPVIDENFKQADENEDGQLDRMEFAVAAGQAEESEAAE